MLCDRSTPTINEKIYSLKALLCMRIAFPYTMCELEINLTWAEPFEMNANVELVSNFVVIMISSMPKKLKR